MIAQADMPPSAAATDALIYFELDGERIPTWPETGYRLNLALPSIDPDAKKKNVKSGARRWVFSEPFQRPAVDPRLFAALLAIAELNNNNNNKDHPLQHKTKTERMQELPSKHLFIMVAAVARQKAAGVSIFSYIFHEEKSYFRYR